VAGLTGAPEAEEEDEQESILTNPDPTADPTADPSLGADVTDPTEGPTVDEAVRPRTLCMPGQLRRLS
jgi:hypothetical protein